MPSSAKLSCLPIALVALSMAFGASAVRAQSDENATSWREIAVDPIMDAVHAIEARLASMEASVALFAGSFTTQQLNTRQLCVSDETGAQTCITKEQLDSLLAKMAQAAAVEPAPAAQDATGVIEAPASVVEAPAAVEAPVAISSDVSTVPAPEASDAEAKPSITADTTVDETAAAAQPADDNASKEDGSAGIEQSATETATVVAPEPAAIPTEAAPQDGTPRDQEPAITGSVTSEPSGGAVISSPSEEVSTPNTTSPNQ